SLDLDGLDLVADLDAVYDFDAARDDAEVRVLLVEERGIFLNDEPLATIIDSGVRTACDPDGAKLEREIVVFRRHLLATGAGPQRIAALDDPVLDAVEDLVVVEAALGL